jgi:GTP-binding protein
MEYSGAVIDKLSQRMGELRAMDGAGDGRTRLEFYIPTRSLIGYRSEMLTDTRGTGIMATTFAGYGAYQGPLKSRPRGVLVALENGETSAYSLSRLQDRGILFVREHVPSTPARSSASTAARTTSSSTRASPRS